MTTSTTTTCPLCWEDHDQPLQVLCSTISSSDHRPHECCRNCALRWIQKSEQASSRMPRCPFCRLCLSQNRVEAILGRPFQATATAESDDDDNLLLTRQWLSERTRQCLHCQSYILKVEGTCNLMECLCGFRFCYECGSSSSSSSGAAQQLQCQCMMDSSQGCAHHIDEHYYWDNVFDRPASRAPPPCASVVTNSTTTSAAEAAGGAIDLRGHLKRRKAEYKRNNHETERWFWSFMMVVISGVVAHWFMLQDDDEGMSLMAIDASTCKVDDHPSDFVWWWHQD